MADERGVPHLAERLSDLFARVPQPGTTQPYNNEAAAEALRRQGVPVTGVYLSQLRNGKKDNPRAGLLAAIAQLFGVSIDYFFDATEAETVVMQLNRLARLRAAGLHELLARADEISPESLAQIAGIIDRIVQLEQRAQSVPTPSTNPGLP
ncbi:MAG: helix-turn-helix domain-containing protein [Nocardioides sp.]